MSIFHNRKNIIIPVIVLTSTAVVAAATSCQNTKTEYSVTLHAGTGHTINGQENYSYKTKSDIEYEPRPDESTMTGFNLLGWYKNKDFSGDKVTFPFKVNSDVDLYANYLDVRETYVITFDSNQGTEVPNYNVNKEDSIPTEPVTTLKDNTFNGWEDINNPGVRVTFPYYPSQNADLRAMWTPLEKGYVTLHTNGGSAPENFTKEGDFVFKSNESMSQLLTAPTTTKANFNLEGWYTDSELKSRVKEFPLKVTADIDLYAKWDSVATGGYTLTLKDNDGTDLDTLSNVCTIGYEPIVPSETISSHAKNHEIFKQWREGSAGGEAITEYPVTITKDTAFYAEWETNTKCNIRLYDTDGKTQIGELITDYYKGDVIGSPFAYEGSSKGYCTFNGWKDSQGIISYPYKLPTDKDEISLTADVSIDSAIINVYDSEDVSKGPIRSFGNIKSLDSQPEIVIAKRLEDYKLNYLCTNNSSQSGSRIDFTNPFKVSEHTSLIDNHEIKLYAVWKGGTDRKYTITLNYKEEEIMPSPVPETHVMEHQTGSIKPSSFEKITDIDREIEYWKNENGDRVENDVPITLVKDRTFYAHWHYTHRNVSVLRYDGNKVTYEHQPVSLKLSTIPKITRANYTLMGFKVLTETGTPTYSLDQSITLSDDNSTVIEEVWQISSNKMTIVYSDSTLGITLPDKVIEDQPLSFNTNTLPTATYVDYEITGYKYTKGGVTKTYNLGETIELDSSSSTSTIYAVWKQNAFTVSFEYNITGVSLEPYKLEHVSKLTKDNIPTLTYAGKRCVGYSTTAGGDVISLVGVSITENKTYYAKWADTGTKFKVTFNLGSVQMNAKFSDATLVVTDRSYTTPEREEALTYDACPKVECEGCVFLGWYTSESEETQPVFPLTTTQTLYARFAPLAGYVSVCFNINDGGTFTSTNTSSLLLTLVKDTLWSEVSSKISEITFGDAFKVDYWKDGDGTKVTESYKFEKNTYLYSVEAEDKKDNPTSFVDDNWPTFCAFIEKGFTSASTKTHANGGYQEEYGATSFTYKGTTYSKSKDTFVGLLRTLKYRDTEYTVRVVGQKQDYSSTTSGKKLTLTFEFVDLISFETWDVNRYSASAIYPKLKQNGTIYNDIQYSLSNTTYNHIKPVTKYTSYSSGTDTLTNCYLFLPSLYEIGITNVRTYDNKFTYTYYSSSTADTRKKIYADKSYCSYWVRCCNGSWPYFITPAGASGGESSIPTGRGIAPMFCVGTDE